MFEITAMGPAGVGLEERIPELLAIGITVLRETVAAQFLRRQVRLDPPELPRRRSQPLRSAHEALRAEPSIKWTVALPGAGRDLGRAAYEPVWRAMQGFTDIRTADTPDELWSRRPSVHLGETRQARRADAGRYPGAEGRSRRGDLTFKARSLAYPLLDLKRLKVGVRDYVCRIEQALIDTLGHWVIHAERRDGAARRVRGRGQDRRPRHPSAAAAPSMDWPSTVAMDLSPFHRINPARLRRAP